MAKQPTITVVTTGFSSATAIDLNFANVKAQFLNTISIDGSAPNAMAGDLDMDGNDILNVGTMDVANLTVNQLDLSDIYTTVGNSGDINALSLNTGDLLYYDGANIVALAIGSTDQVLKESGGIPSWAADTDTDTVGVTVEEDDVSILANVTIINFLTGLQATTPIVTSPGAGQVVVDLETFVNG